MFKRPPAQTPQSHRVFFTIIFRFYYARKKLLQNKICLLKGVSSNPAMCLTLLTQQCIALALYKYYALIKSNCTVCAVLSIFIDNKDR